MLSRRAWRRRQQRDLLSCAPSPAKVQGFYYSAPVPALEATELLRQRFVEPRLTQIPRAIARGFCVMNEVPRDHEGPSPPGPAPPLTGTENLFRLFFDAVADGIFVSNPTTGRFIEINQPGCSMFGYTKSELIGRDGADLGKDM